MENTKIYTLTLNPAYDIHAHTEHFVPFHENLARVLSREAGGKGVNISRALKLNGTDNTAIIILGKENSADFKQAVADAELDAVTFEVDGRIRENLTLHASDSDETRISFAGFSVDDSILDEIAAKIEAGENTVVTFTGRAPAGMSMERIKAFLLSLKAKGTKIVIDSRSFSLADIIEVSPWLIKPNQEEISEYFGCEIKNFSDAAASAESLASKGIENVMISLGGKGALLYTAGKLFTAKAPKIEALSTIGAGDSSIAGFIAAYSKGRSPEDCLRTAVAFGSAACLTEGTLPPMSKDVSSIYEMIVTE